MDSRKLKDKATEAFARGKFAKAGETYAAYCETDPSDLHARLRMGDAWAKCGQKEKAIGAYSWAAEGFAKEGFLPRAIAASKLILELDPSHKGVQKMLADLYARKNQPAPRRPGTLAPVAAPAPAVALAAPTAVASKVVAIELAASESTSDEVELTVGEATVSDEVELSVGEATVSGEIEIASIGVGPQPSAPTAPPLAAAAAVPMPPVPAAVASEPLPADAPPPPALPLAAAPAPAETGEPPPGKAPPAPPPSVYQLEDDGETLDAYAATLEAAAPAPAPAELLSAPPQAVVPPVAPAMAPAVLAPPGLKPRRPAEPPPEAAPAAQGGDGRIWLPPGFAPPAISPMAPPSGASPGPAASPALARGAATDLEKSLEAFSRFDIDEAPPTRPPPAFTELELEGDSLLHAVEAAAHVGAEQRGEAQGAAVEEAMDAPEPERQDAGALPKIPLFSDLPEEAFIALFESCPLKRAEPGDLLVTQGTRGDAFYVICAGSVRVFRTDQGQRRDLATLEEGAFFGEMALLSDAPRSASVEAASPDTQLLEISAVVLADLSTRHPQVATALKKFCRQRMLSNVMAQAPLFQPFSRSDRRDLVQKFRAREVKKGEVVIREGQRSDGMYVILAGEVEVTVGTNKVASLKEGEVFGEMSLLTKAPATATVTSSKRTSLLRLPREDFDVLILSHPQILVLVSDLTDERTKKNAQRAPADGGAAPMV